jgi:hypothetical protein
MSDHKAAVHAILVAYVHAVSFAFLLSGWKDLHLDLHHH